MPFLTKRIFGWDPLEINDNLGLRSLKNGNGYQPCFTCFCEKCSFIFCDIRFNEEEMNRLYHDYRGSLYNSQRQFFESDYKEISDYLSKSLHYLDMVETYIKSHVSRLNTILDWGGDTGINTPFRSEKCSLFIYDISEKPSVKTVNGIKVINNLLGRENSFDLITALHVFEHLSNPRENLIKLSRYLVPGGSVYIEVPLEKLVDFENPTAKDAKGKFHWHEHINFYSKKSLSEMLDSAGLEIVDLRYQNVSDSFRNFEIQQVIGRKTMS